MPRNYEPIDPAKLKTYSIADRTHKSAVASFARLPRPGATARELLESLPAFLGAEAFRRIVEATVAARRADRPVVWAIGAHVVKVGCSPIVVDLIRSDIITAVATHGAGAIHDVEVATQGATSEEVAETIREGTFGMVRETAAVFREALASIDRTAGLGAAIGRWLCEHRAPHAEHSILAAAFEKGIPATVHVALGTDTVHALDTTDGAAVGRASMTDFRTICAVVGDLAAAEGSSVGGVWYNIGSAVVLPEVFLKAVSVARNLGADLDRMVTANLDMIRHYRPQMNVIERPVAPGMGHEVCGQHEVLLPLLRQALIEKLSDRKVRSAAGRGAE